MLSIILSQSVSFNLGIWKLNPEYALKFDIAIDKFLSIACFITSILWRLKLEVSDSMLELKLNILPLTWYGLSSLSSL